MIARATPQISSEEARAFVLSTIALTSGAFTISFWYGVFGTIFFEHLFYIWVTATVALVASLFVPPLDALPAFMSWRGRFVLALPSVWIMIAFIGNGEPGGNSTAAAIEWLLTIATVVLTLPYLLYVLILVIVPDIEQIKSTRLLFAMISITIAIACAGYGIGRNHPSFLTCYDFKVSDSDIPQNCRNAVSGT